jgi:tripartite-type tricarboxylate transporter receptor subunit TctC
METRMRWLIDVLGIVIFLMTGISDVLAASNYPTRSIEIAIAFGPGGGSDNVMRLYKDKVEKYLGQPIVIAYKPGAGGVVAGTYVKEAKPDGYTLLMVVNATMALAQLVRKADFTFSDFTPVCTLTYAPIIFCVNVDSPYKSMKDFIQAAKTKKMKYSTTGAYSPEQIYIEAIGRQAGFQAIHVPAAGGAAAMTAVLGGHVDMAACVSTGIESQLRTLAVASQSRAESFPDVYTLKELGYPIENEMYYTVWAPKGTPKEIANRIYDAYRKTLEEDREEITRRAKGLHQIARVTGPEETRKITQDGYDFFKDMLSKMGTPAK